MNQFEEKQIYLVESRGVAGSPWKPELVAITEFIQRYVKEEWNKTHATEINFEVPQNLVDKISFLSNGIIRVKAKYNLFVINDYSGYCKFQDDVDPVIIDNKLNGIEIFLSVIYDMYGNVKQKYFFSTLVHEINHAFEMYCTIKKDEDGKYIEKCFNKYYSTVFSNSLINDIMYYLFCDTETNALIASVYGELQELKSKREYFHNDILNTEGYNVYKKIRDNYINTINNLSKEELQHLKHHLFTYNVFTSEKTDDVDFKRKLINKIHFLLNELLKKISRAASLYYDEVENEETKYNSLKKIRFYNDKK